MYTFIMSTANSIHRTPVFNHPINIFSSLSTVFAIVCCHQIFWLLFNQTITIKLYLYPTFQMTTCSRQAVFMLPCWCTLGRTKSTFLVKIWLQLWYRSQLHWREKVLRTWFCIVICSIHMNEFCHVHVDKVLFFN